jgi:hypothetical protein
MGAFGIFLALFVFLQFPLFLNSSSLLAAEGKVLVFGRVHDDPVRSIKDRQEFVDYLAAKLAPLGITAGRILVVEKMHLLAQALKEGKVDLFMTALCQRWCFEAGRRRPDFATMEVRGGGIRGDHSGKENSGIKTLLI